MNCGQPAIDNLFQDGTWCKVITGPILTVIAILGLSPSSILSYITLLRVKTVQNSLTAVSFLMNIMHNFALFCTEMHCFGSPLIETAFDHPIFDLSIRKVRVTRVSGQYRLANNVIKTLTAVSADKGFYLKFLPGVAKTLKPLTDHRIF